MKLVIAVEYSLAISCDFLVAQLTILAKSLYAMQPEYMHTS